MKNSMRHVIGIDLGTSGAKAVLFDEKGKAVASAAREYPMSQPHNGWAEQDPKDWADAAFAAIREVVDRSRAPAGSIAALGISGQMHGLVMLGGDGAVLRPAILWCDQRTGKECELMTEAVGRDRLIAITANPAITGFTASKILWVRRNQPGIYEKCRHILLPKDYLRYRLTGDLATDLSDASGMQLLDVPNRRWSDEVLGKLGIDKALLARVYESPEVTGTISAGAASLTGLSEKTLVVGGAGDNAAAAVGTGVVADGRAFTTIGSSGVVYVHTDKLAIDPKGRVHTFCCAVPGAWHIMGVTQAAGLSLQWFRNRFCSEEVEQAAREGKDAYQIMTGQASEVPIGADRLIYLPYLMGERTPHLDPDCRGVFFGLSAMHTRAHMIRAIMEGVSFSLRDCLSVIEEMGASPETMLACGGGGASPFWRQMLSDVFNMPVATVDSKEGPALGVAILAAVGAGIFPDVRTACDAMIRVNPPQEACAGNAEKYREVYGLYKKLYPALKGLFGELDRMAPVTPAGGGRQEAGKPDPKGADRDQRGADQDQRGADRDQIGADRDERGAGRDQMGVGQDQMGAEEHHRRAGNEVVKKGVAEEIRSFIEANYAGDINLGMFSKKYYVSKEYLSRCFKEAFGCGIYEYLSRTRMDKARELLMDTDAKIRAVTELVGYKDQNYFSRVFRKRYGVYPSEYRADPSRASAPADPEAAGGGPAR